MTHLNCDQPGSTVFATDSAGNEIGRSGYKAYGGDRNGSELATEHRYTGQNGDSTGLMYYSARYYDPTLGTFISPDTIVPDPTNVFDFNRYMYVRGRVMNMNDPSGHQASCMMDQDLNWQCNGSATASALTVKNDTEYQQPECQSACGSGPVLVTAAIGLGAFGAALYGPAIIASLTGGACGDGDCTNEVNGINTANNVVNSSKTVLEYVTKTEARAALQAGIDGLSQGQTQRAFDILGKGRVDVFSVNLLQNNQVQMVADRTGFDGFQRLIYTIDSSGKVLGLLQEAYNAAGELVHVHDKLSGIILKRSQSNKRNFAEISKRREAPEGSSRVLEALCCI